MEAIQYILLSTICLSFFYGAYRLIYRSDTNFSHLRFYLLGSIILSLLIPLSNYSLELRDNNISSILLPEVNSQPNTDSLVPEISTKPGPDWQTVVLRVYFLVTILFLFRIFRQLGILLFNYLISFKIKQKDCVLLLNHRFRSTFSFFTWIFIVPGSTSKEELDQIIAHERIHASQHHSFDLILIELLTAVMWFNPLIWMMKNTIQLVHEYLADKGALNSGIDRLKYQALLINQVTEERLICLSSSFNHSLIKKRMKMMTTSNFNQKTRFRILTLLPLSASLLLMMAVVNGSNATDTKDNSVQMNAEPAFSGDASNQGIPQDTVKKKTITKIEKKGNQQDTVITESYDVMAPDGSTKTFRVVRKGNPEDLEDLEMEINIPEEEQVEHSENLNHSENETVEISTHNTNQDKATTITKIEVRSVNDHAHSKILYVIDGVTQTEKDPFSKLNPDDIESIEVLKDEKIRNYTDGDYDGVIVIKMRAGKK